jgi:hypothetical protein
MEATKFDSLKNNPVLIEQIRIIFNDPQKFAELENLVKVSGLFIESVQFKKQFSIQTVEELYELKDFLNQELVPA